MIPDGEEMALRLSPQAFRFDDRPSSNRSSRPISGDHSSGHGDKHSRDGQDVKARRDKQSDLDDDWSRTALPIDLDAQSFMTSLTTIDVVDSKGDLIPQPLEINSPKHSNDTFHGPLRLPQSSSAPESSSRVHSTSPAPSIPEPIPPKSIARNYLGLLATDLLAPDVTPPPTKPKAPRAASIPGENGANHAASYLQEARKAVTTSPRPAAAGSAAPSGQQQQQLRGISSPNLPISKAPALNASSRDLRGGAPIAKVLVECCSCKFFQDMPSRVYECMARPDAVVEDSRLGVSGAITTCVRCPWCGHNMSTKCCAGYAAVVYLKEKLHGA
ncbi:hypothetical protein NKR23_g11496 [Pleurostoma richardsiae]|uniref:Uncharacterized protein n=1 Tax=Pleurostoma richardsiae TaxID=41990 RepID=A0AA38VH89_9PEZI|nr:hypothetical protein NKR23_g11496 [Pleurostoma richardsiae]